MEDALKKLAKIDPEDLLEDILEAGKDLLEKSKEHTGDLTAKGKQIAAKGEDYLVDKLDIDDTAIDDRSAILLKAMVSAAKADGLLHAEEVDIIKAYEGATVESVQAVMDQPANPKAIAALADSDQAAAEIYAVSCRVANGLNPKERDYLDALAMGLKLDPELAAKIETEMRTG